MDLKDFIKDVVTSISEATAELQIDLAEHGVTVTQARATAPADDAPQSGDPSGAEGRPRQVEKIDFDLAVLAAQDGGAAGVRVVGPETAPAVADGVGAERVSRVVFSVEISYPLARDDLAGRSDQRRERSRPRRRAGGGSKWSRF